MVGNVLLDFARTFDDRKLLVLFAIVVATILIDSELGVVSDFIPETISSNAGAPRLPPRGPRRSAG